MPVRTLFHPVMGAGANPAMRIGGPAPTHFAVQMGGAGYLTNPNADGRFFFNGAPSTTMRVMTWVMLNAKADYQEMFRLGSGASAADDCYGLQYNVATDRFDMFKSNSAFYTSLQTGFSPVIGTWYGLAVSYGYNAFSFDIYDLAGLIASYSLGLGDNGYNPVPPKSLGVGATSIGSFPLTGKLDSFSFSYSPLGNPAPGGVLFHGGLAPDWGELSPADHLALETVILWADFNEVSGTTAYADSSGNGSTLTRTGAGLTRVNGAGY